MEYIEADPLLVFLMTLKYTFVELAQSSLLREVHDRLLS